MSYNELIAEMEANNKKLKILLENYSNKIEELEEFNKKSSEAYELRIDALEEEIRFLKGE